MSERDWRKEMDRCKAIREEFNKEYKGDRVSMVGAMSARIETLEREKQYWEGLYKDLFRRTYQVEE